MTRYGFIACVALVLALCSEVLAQASVEEAAASAANPQVSSEEESPAELEPLTVTGERSRVLVQREMVAAQDQAFEMFNALNNEDDYDMVCRRERPSGSQFIHRVCKGRFHRDIESSAAQDFFDMLKAGADLYHVNRTVIDQGYDHQRALMIKLATGNPEYRQLLEKYYALRQEFEEKGGTVRYLVNSE